MNRAESALSAPPIVSLASWSLADSVPLTTSRRSARALKRSALAVASMSMRTREAAVAGGPAEGSHSTEPVAESRPPLAPPAPCRVN